MTSPTRLHTTFAPSYHTLQIRASVPVCLLLLITNHLSFYKQQSFIRLLGHRGLLPDGAWRGSARLSEALAEHAWACDVLFPEGIDSPLVTNYFAFRICNWHPRSRASWLRKAARQLGSEADRQRGKPGGQPGSQAARRPSSRLPGGQEPWPGSFAIQSSQAAKQLGNPGKPGKPGSPAKDHQPPVMRGNQPPGCTLM